MCQIHNFEDVVCGVMATLAMLRVVFKSLFGLIWVRKVIRNTNIIPILSNNIRIQTITTPQESKKIT